MILTEEAKVPIRCERYQVDPEVVSRNVRHSSVPGRLDKPLEEDSARRRRIKSPSHMETHQTFLGESQENTARIFRMPKQEFEKDI